MFRPPMRLEKWIAYDAAIGADLLVADADSDADDGMDDALFTFVTGEAEGGEPGNVQVRLLDTPVTAFSISQATDTNGEILSDADDGKYHISDGDTEIAIGIDFPKEAPIAPTFPFLNFNPSDNIFTVTTSGGDGTETGDLWIDIDNPAGGEFWFEELEEVENKYGVITGDSYALFSFLDSLDTNPTGGRVSGITNNALIAFYSEVNGENVLQVYRLINHDRVELDDYTSNYEGRLEEVGFGIKVTFEQTDTGIRLYFENFNAKHFQAKDVLNGIFRSLTYTDNNNDTTPNKIPSVSVSVSYATKNTPPLVVDPPVIADPVVVPPSLPPPSDDGGDNQPDPDPGDDIIPPVVPPPPPSDSGDSGGDAGDSGDSGENGSDSGDSAESGADGESGDSADGLGSDDLAFVFQSDDSADSAESAGADADADAESAENAAAEEADEAEARDGAQESAAAAEQLELARDLEFLLTAVQNDKDILLSHIGRLESEYLARNPGEYGELRGYLRRLFDLARQEEDTVNRILAAMNREMEVFRSTDPANRDGMLTESVRELIESAERHSGEMGAYSSAVEAVAGLLASRRADGLPPPSDAEASSLFAAEYESALSAWQASVDAQDPIGRDLTAAQRVAEG